MNENIESEIVTLEKLKKRKKMKDIIKYFIWVLLWFYALFLALFFLYAVLNLIFEKNISFFLQWFILAFLFTIISRYYFEFTYFGLVEKKRDVD